MINTTDIIVIGAGIAGTSAAAALAEHNRVVVLEQEAHPGYHATGRSAATWAPFYGPEIIRQLTVMSKPLLSEPEVEFSDQPFTSPKGEMIVGRAEDKEEIDKHLSLGMQKLSLGEAHEIVPLIRADQVVDILYTPEMLDIDVDSLHQAYIKWFKKLNGKLVVNAQVTGLEFYNNQWNVETPAGNWRADIVVNAAGAWADHIAALAGAKTLGMQPKKRTAALVPFHEQSKMHQWPMVFGAGEKFYCTPFGSGLLISPADEAPVDAHDAWPQEIDIARGIDEFQHYIDYEVEQVTHQWAGLRTFAPDGIPVAGFDSELSNFFWLAGQGGYGIQTSAAIASLCNTIINQRQPAPGNNRTPFNIAPNDDLTIIDKLIKSLSPARFS